MGEVYRARDTRLDRTVAIKILPEHLSINSQSRERFEREAKAISGLSHPHICPLYDVGQQDGVDYLVMEYLEGETIATRLKKGPLPLDQALTCAIQIAGAFDQAHRHGVVHRDLKPGNVMMTRSGAKLLDFGLAKIGESASSAAAGRTALSTQTAALTHEGAVLGTFQYMEPEQLEGAESDARTDIFAFGPTLYEMLTGHKAFEGKAAWGDYRGTNRVGLTATMRHIISGAEPLDAVWVRLAEEVIKQADRPIKINLVAGDGEANA
jgi:serine/threonine protein kinase